MRTLILTLTAVTLTSCVTGPSGKSYCKFRSANPRWGLYEELRDTADGPHAETIKKRQISIGMTKKEVSISWALFWARTPDISTTVVAGETYETWGVRSSPGDFLPSTYLTFRDGILIGWQDYDFR